MQGRLPLGRLPAGGNGRDPLHVHDAGPSSSPPSWEWAFPCFLKPRPPSLDHPQPEGKGPPCRRCRGLIPRSPVSQRQTMDGIHAGGLGHGVGGKAPARRSRRGPWSEDPLRLHATGPPQGPIRRTELGRPAAPFPFFVGPRLRKSSSARKIFMNDRPRELMQLLDAGPIKTKTRSSPSGQQRGGRRPGAGNRKGTWPVRQPFGPDLVEAGLGSAR